MFRLRVRPAFVLSLLFTCAYVIAGETDKWTVRPPDALMLQFAGASESGDNIALKFSNASKNTVISAYTVCIITQSDKACHGKDWAYGMVAEGLKPGESDTIYVSKDIAEKADYTLTIVAVVFDNGIVQGIRDDILRIELKRLGRVLEMKRMYPIIKNASENASDADPDIDEVIKKIGESKNNGEDQRLIDDLKEAGELIGLSVPDLNNYPQGVRASFIIGAKSERSNMLGTLKQLNRPANRAVTDKSKKQDLLNLGNVLNERASRLLVICKRAQGRIN